MMEYRLEEYYRKFVELQEKLKKSEEERFILEMKFNQMVQVAREEEQAHYRKLRAQYKRFLEEDKKRQDRNERIVRNLERIETRFAMLSAKTERVNMLRRQYQNFLLRIARASPNVPHEEKTFVKEPTQKLFLPQEKAPCIDKKPQKDYRLAGKPLDNLDITQPLFEYPAVNKSQSNEEKLEILDRYLENVSSERCRELLNQRKEAGDKFTSDTRGNFCLNDLKSNHATALADDIMISIYSRYYNKLDEDDKLRNLDNGIMQDALGDRKDDAKAAGGDIDQSEHGKDKLVSEKVDETDGDKKFIGNEAGDVHEQDPKQTVQDMRTQIPNQKTPSHTYQDTAHEGHFDNPNVFILDNSQDPEQSHQNSQINSNQFHHNIDQEVHSDQNIVNQFESSKEKESDEQYMIQSGPIHKPEHASEGYSVDSNNLQVNHESVEEIPHYVAERDQSNPQAKQCEQNHYSVDPNYNQQDVERDHQSENNPQHQKQYADTNQYEQEQTNQHYFPDEATESDPHLEQYVVSNQQAQFNETQEQYGSLHPQSSHGEEVQYQNQEQQQEFRERRPSQPSGLDSSQHQTQEFYESQEHQFDSNQKQPQDDQNQFQTDKYQVESNQAPGSQTPQYDNIDQEQTILDQNQYSKEDHQFEFNQQSFGPPRTHDDGNHYQMEEHHSNPTQQDPEFHESPQYANIDQQQTTFDHSQYPTEFDPNQHSSDSQQAHYEQSYNQQYDENGQPIQYDQQQGYDQYGQPVLYDQHGQMVEPQYDEQGQILPQYDENGQLIMLYDQNGQPCFSDDQHQQYYDQDQYTYDNQYNQEEVGKINEEKDEIIKEGEKQSKVVEILDTDTESSKQNVSKVSNDTDFDFS